MKRLTYSVAVSCLSLVTATLWAAGDLKPARPLAAPKVPAPARQKVTAPANLPAPISATSPLTKVDPTLLIAQGEVVAVVRLKDSPLATAVGPNARRKGSKLTPAQQKAYVNRLIAGQQPVANTITKNGGKVVGRMTKALNALIVQVDAKVLPKLAQMATVSTIRPIGDYQVDLANTVPHIGAADLHSLGVKGAGIRVAVLDSGIDYTHASFGGAGTAAAYDAAYGDPVDATGFPTAKVVGGYDFVGEVWPSGARSEDPDPIAKTGTGNHGTHVADIIAGTKGVAPEASLLAFKVCSAVATSCNGVAMLLGLEASADPNGDSNIADAVDVVNLSLGLSYGLIQDDSAFAVQSLVDMGIVVVCSAGNSGDKPYIVGSPSIAPGAISVAQTQVPGAKALTLGLGAGTAADPTQFIANTASLDWAPVTAPVSGLIAYVGRACPPPTDPALPDLTGKVALIDRATCAISLKVENAFNAGAVAVIIANNAPGDPPSFSFGGDDLAKMLPTLVISQADGAAIKTALGSASVKAFLSPDLYTPLANSMVSTSSRGPAISSQGIKPDIGAPGASVSAEAGTGTGETAFGGTSGAAPMVAGAAALLLNKFPGLAPHEVKARLMNSAETDIYLNPITLPEVTAPITRIGAGEVRVNRSADAKSLAYDRDTKIASLSFSYRAISKSAVGNTFHRWIEVCNLGSSPKTYTPSSSFRYADDEASGAVAVTFTPKSLTVNGGGKGVIRMAVTVDGTKLPNWGDFLNGGFFGGSGEGLRTLEFDGYVTLNSEPDPALRLPWQILPRKAADVRPTQKALTIAKTDGSKTTLTLKNQLGCTTGLSDVFDLLGTSPINWPNPVPPGANIAVVDLKSFGARPVFLPGSIQGIQLAVATHGEPAFAIYPQGIEVDIDVDDDGFVDFAVWQEELPTASGSFAVTGQSVTRIYDIQADTSSYSPFYTDCDFNSGWVVMTIPMNKLGAGTTWDTPLNMEVYGYDNYFTGFVSDYMSDGPFYFRYTPSQPRFYAGAPTWGFDVPTAPAGTTALDVFRWSGGDMGSPSHKGLLLLHRDATPKRWTDEIPVTVLP